MELAYAVVKSFRAINHPAYIVDLETGWDGSEYHLGFYLKERQHLAELKQRAADMRKQAKALLEQAKTLSSY